jgi:hypothetical protein
MRLEIAALFHYIARYLRVGRPAREIGFQNQGLGRHRRGPPVRREWGLRGNINTFRNG